jgi:hypothetical protein
MAQPLEQVRFGLHISAEAMEEYYRGAAQAVHVTCDDGRTVRFPARVLRPFVTRAGVHGRFALFFDSDGRFVRIEQLRQPD